MDTALLLGQAPSTSAQTEWQRQYDAAVMNRNSGKKKMLIGAGLLAGGLEKSAARR